MHKLPISVRLRLARLRWTIRAYVLLEGIAILVLWLGLTFWVGLALDYLPVLAGASEMPLGVRAILLLGISAVLAWLLYRWVLSRTLVRMGNENMAVLLERHFPGFKDALLTSVEMQQHPDHAEEFNEQMLAHTSRDAVETMRGIRLSKVLKISPLAIKVVIALVLVGSVGLFSSMNREAFGLWVKRMYLLEDEPWPRKSRIEVVGVELQRETSDSAIESAPALSKFGDAKALKVAKGASVRVLVHADAKRIVPDKCTIYYRTDEGDRGRVDMKRIGNPQNDIQLYTFDAKPFRGILSNITFDVRGGDHRVRDYKVQVVDSPAIVKTDVRCVFPEYLVNHELALWLPRTLELTSGMQVPIGTDLTFECTTNKPIRRVDFIIPAKEKGEAPTIESLEITPKSADKKPESADKKDDKRLTFTYPAGEITDTFTLDVVLHDVDGVVSDNPHRIFVAGIPDEAPKVNVTLRGIGTAVTEDVLIPIEGTIQDDYEVAKQWFHVEINDQAPSQLPIQIQPANKVQDRIDFRQLRNDETGIALKPKDKLLLIIQAEDKHSLGSGPNIGNGDRYQLDVVTKDELLTMLDRRELGLRKRFEQIIDELLLMRDSLAWIAGENDVTDPAGVPGEDDLTAEQKAERLKSLNLLRVQRSETQSQKSAQEVLGVAYSFEDIRLELENNRVDTEERKNRLEQQITEPLKLIAETMFPALDEKLQELDKGLSEDSTDADEMADATLLLADDILLELDKVLSKMLELEDYNALVNLVRQILDDQSDLLDRTKTLRKNSALELLK